MDEFAKAALPLGQVLDDPGHMRTVKGFDGPARGGIHVKMPVGMPELVTIVSRAIAERTATGLDQAAGVIRSPAPNTPRRTLHLP